MHLCVEDQSAAEINRCFVKYLIGHGCFKRINGVDVADIISRLRILTARPAREDLLEIAEAE